MVSAFALIAIQENFRTLSPRLECLISSSTSNSSTSMLLNMAMTLWMLCAGRSERLQRECADRGGGESYHGRGRSPKNTSEGGKLSYGEGKAMPKTKDPLVYVNERARKRDINVSLFSKSSRAERTVVVLWCAIVAIVFINKCLNAALMFLPRA